MIEVYWSDFVFIVIGRVIGFIVMFWWMLLVVASIPPAIREFKKQLLGNNWIDGVRWHTKLFCSLWYACLEFKRCLFSR